MPSCEVKYSNICKSWQEYFLAGLPVKSTTCYSFLIEQTSSITDISYFFTYLFLVASFFDHKHFSRVYNITAFMYYSISVLLFYCFTVILKNNKTVFHNYCISIFLFFNYSEFLSFCFLHSGCFFSYLLTHLQMPDLSL
jgi:hypothetical protein